MKTSKNSHSIGTRKASDRADYGYARFRDIAFDAIRTLWLQRKQEGLTQAEIARILNRDPAWVSRQMRGPGNWTLRTIGELVEALQGEAEMVVHPLESPLGDGSNYDAYDDYVDEPEGWRVRPLDPGAAKVHLGNDHTKTAGGGSFNYKVLEGA